MIKFLFKIAILLVLIALCSSCGKEPIERYCGGIIVYRHTSFLYGSYFVLKYEGYLTKPIYLYEYDYRRYKEGDTIKCSSQDSINNNRERHGCNIKR